MVLRKLTKEDAALLQECRLFGLVESPEAFLVSYEEVAGTPLAAVESELEDPSVHYLGAFTGEHLVGFIRFVRAHRQSRRHTAEVRSVYVKKAARGQRIGTQLLGRLIQDAGAAGIESLTLSVLDDNVAARRLYDSLGFQLYGTEHRAIRKGGQYIDQSLYSLNLAAT